MRWLLPILLVSCASSQNGETAEEEATPDVALVMSVGELPEGPIYRTSRSAGFADMCEELAPADVVYVGEFHTNAEHHKAQLMIIRQLHAYGRLDAIGLEMFQRPYQKHLDDYVAGRIELDEMLEKTDYKKRWGYDVELYRAIFEFARQHRIEMVALNVSNELRKIVSEKGYEGLSPEQRDSLPEPDKQFEGYADRFEALVRAHAPKDKPDWKPDPKMVARYQRVQMLWDDVMADSVVQWMRRRPEGAQMVVLAGGGHISESWGIPARARKRAGGVHKTLVMGVDKQLRDKMLAQRYADFVWVTK